MQIPSLTNVCMPSLFFDAANYGDKVPNEKWYGNNYSMDDLWEGNEGKWQAEHQVSTSMGQQVSS